MIRIRSSQLEVVVDPSTGAEIVSIVDRRTDVSILASAPDSRERKKRGELSLDEWESGYRGGWQILTPNAGEQSQFEGVTHGFHGRASNDPWNVEVVNESSAILTWQGHGLRVSRQLEVRDATVNVATTWTAISVSSVPMVHVEHLALGSAFLEHDVLVNLPGSDGDVNSCVNLATELPALTFNILGPFRQGFVEVVAREASLSAILTWDAEQLPYLWLWHENHASEGVFGASGRVLGIEPASVGTDAGLERAIELDQATWISPGESVTRTISLEMSTPSPNDPRESGSRVGSRVFSGREADSRRNSEAFGEARVVDAHQHFWDLGRGRYPWLQDPSTGSAEEAINRRFASFGVQEYLAEIEPLPVAASVHVEANWDAEDPVAETRWLQSLHEEFGWPSAIVGAVRLEAPEAERFLEDHAQNSAFRGVRDLLGWHATNSEFQAARGPHQMSSEAWLSGFDLLGRFGLSFDLHVYPHQLLEAVELATAFPNTTIVLNHCASPDEVGKDRDLWSEGLSALADCRNVSVKLSGITQPSRSLDAVLSYTSEVIGTFGCGRTMFGSNLPVEQLAGSVGMLVDALRVVLSNRSSKDRDAVWGGNAARIYQIPLPAESESTS